VTATLQGAPFYTSGTQTYNSFRGALEPDRLTFQLSAAGSYYDWQFGWKYFPVFPNVLEQLTAGTYFSVYGLISLTGSGATRSGTLNGVIETIGGPPEFVRINSCESSSHRLAITR
jgi:hypothetical protein